MFWTGSSRTAKQEAWRQNAGASRDFGVMTVQKSGFFGRFSKADVRCWQSRILRQSYTRDGKTLLTKDRAMKIAHQGRRETFPLAPEQRSIDSLYKTKARLESGRDTLSIYPDA